MKTKQTFNIVIIAALAIAIISTTAWAKKPDPLNECPAGLAGTWFGGASTDLRWFAAQTSDSLDPTKGEMILNWTYIKPSFPGGINSGVTLTTGHGIWQLNDDGDYDYTWYAYAISTDETLSGVAVGAIAYTIRVSGVAMLRDIYDPTVIDCDSATIYYQFDVAEGEVAPMNFSTSGFVNFEEGSAAEVRVPLEVTPLPSE